MPSAVLKWGQRIEWQWYFQRWWGFLLVSLSLSFPGRSHPCNPLILPRPSKTLLSSKILCFKSAKYSYVHSSLLLGLSMLTDLPRPLMQQWKYTSYPQGPRLAGFNLESSSRHAVLNEKIVCKIVDTCLFMFIQYVDPALEPQGLCNLWPTAAFITRRL